MEAIWIKIIEYGGIPLLMFVIGWLVGKYVKPWIHNTDHPGRLEWAKELALIADRVTDALVLKFPEAHWDDLVDKAVDTIIAKMGITDYASNKAQAIREEVAFLLHRKENNKLILDSAVEIKKPV